MVLFCECPFTGPRGPLSALFAVALSHLLQLIMVYASKYQASNALNNPVLRVCSMGVQSKPILPFAERNARRV